MILVEIGSNGMIIKKLSGRIRIVTKKLACLNALILAAACSIQCFADETTDEAQRLIQSKQFDQAYALLQPLVDDRAGDPEFDYLIGIAALDAGHLTEAVFALERVLSVNPDHAAARAELARAHLNLGELEQAKFEFESVKRSDLPDSVARTIDDYLAAIASESNRNPTLYDVFLQTGFGYDDNVNGATDASQVAIPALGGLLVSLDGSGQNVDSAIWNISAGIGINTPVRQSETLRFFGGILFDERLALAESDFSTRSLGANSGFHLQRDKHQFRVAAQVQRFYVDGDPNRDLFGGTFQWQYNMTPTTQLTLFGQAAALRYPDQEVRDVDRYTGGIGVAHAFNVRGAPILFVSGYGGVEDENENRRPDLGRDLYGVRVGGQYSFTDRLVGYASFNYEDSEYNGPDPLFFTDRDDNLFDFTVGARFAFDRHWSIRPEIRYTENDSNLVINDYERVNFMVFVRNDF